MTTILPLPAGAWVFDILGDDYRAGASTWRIVDVSDYDYALDVVPPATMRSDGFLVGEPFTHDGSGRAVHAAFVRRAGRFYARYVVRRFFDSERIALHDAIDAAARAPGVHPTITAALTCVAPPAGARQP